MTKSKKTLEFFVIGVCAGGIVIGTAMLVGVVPRGAAKPTLFKIHYDYGPVFLKQIKQYQVSKEKEI